MSEFRILDTNQVFDEDTIITASSQDSEFPSSNLKNIQRAKVWRSGEQGGGNSSAQIFVINNTFNNSLDTDLGTATISPGVYHGNSLAAEVQAQLVALGHDLIVTYDSVTQFFTIAINSGTPDFLWDTGVSTDKIANTIGFSEASDDLNVAVSITSSIQVSGSQELFTINSSQSAFSFDEGGGGLTAAVPFSAFDGVSYNGSQLAQAIETSMNGAGANTYEVTFSTVTGKFTIARTAGANPINLLWDTGAEPDTELFAAMIGFDPDSDDTGATTYTSDVSQFQTSGFFVSSTAFDDRIDYDIGGGPTFLTVPSSSYTGTHLARALQILFGPANATVSFDTSTDKFTITKVGATLDLLWSTGANLARTIAGTIGFETTSDTSVSTSTVSDNMVSGSEVLVLTNDNNVINWNDGVNQTTNITTGMYSGTALAAKAQSQMLAVTTLITVVFGTDGKFTIARSSGTLTLRTGTGNADSKRFFQMIGFVTGTDKSGSQSYTGENAILFSTEFITFDLGDGALVDSAAILFDKVDGSPFTSTAMIKLQANATDSWNSPSIDITLTFDETYQIYSHFFATAQAFRYWRVFMDDPAIGSTPYELGKVILANSTKLTQNPEIGMNDVLADQSKNFETQFGHRYSDIFPERRKFSFTYKALTKGDAETLQIIHRRVGHHLPVSVVLDPLAVNFDKDRFFLYGFLQKSLSVKNNFFTYFDTDFEITEAC